MCNRRRSRQFLAILLAVSTQAVGCFMGEPERAFDVAPSVEMPASVVWGEPFQIIYRWMPGESFPEEPGEYLAFVHFSDPDGQVVAQDDHSPPVPTSQWREGQPVEYRRWFRFPVPETFEYVDVSLGLYDKESGRLAVRSRGRWETEVMAARLRTGEGDYDGTPIAGDGWHRLERDGSGHDLWHWTSESATVIFRNPGRDAELHIEASSPVAWLDGPQRVRISLGGAEIAELVVSEDSRFVERIPLSAAMLGDEPVLEIKIEVDATVVPAEVVTGSEDPRVLGLKVYCLYLSPR